MRHESICGTCGKKFFSQNVDSSICYGCALEHFAGNRAPEEGDFNSALLASGEMTDKEARWLQEDLESVDHSRAETAWRSTSEYYDDDDSDRWDPLEECNDEED